MRLLSQKRFITCLLLLAVFAVNQGNAQSSAKPDSLIPKRLNTLVISMGGLYGSTMFTLNQFWYKDYPQSSFHFFNDNEEWFQIDKIGHATTAYQVGYWGYEVFRWTGLDEKRATLIGGSMGFFFLTTIEILDGFSSQWGASPGDLVANTAGTALFIGQQLAWHEQRISLKFSAHMSPYAQYRPKLMGRNFGERLVKDYNGQTYWLSCNISTFLNTSSRFPKWLNVAVGYGGEGMTGASSNPDEIDGLPLPHFDRYRQFYLSADIDLTRIPTKNKTLKSLFKIVNFLKVPMPTLEYNKKQGLLFHPLYF